MKKVIELLKHEILVEANNLSNLQASLSDAKNKVKKCKEWIASVEQKLSDLDKILEVAIHMNGGVKLREKK